MSLLIIIVCCFYCFIQARRFGHHLRRQDSFEDTKRKSRRFVGFEVIVLKDLHFKDDLHWVFERIDYYSRKPFTGCLLNWGSFACCQRLNIHQGNYSYWLHSNCLNHWQECWIDCLLLNWFHYWKLDENEDQLHCQIHHQHRLDNYDCGDDRHDDLFSIRFSLRTNYHHQLNPSFKQMLSLFYRFTLLSYQRLYLDSHLFLSVFRIYYYYRIL